MLPKRVRFASDLPDVKDKGKKIFKQTSQYTEAEKIHCEYVKSRCELKMYKALSEELAQRPVKDQIFILSACQYAPFRWAATNADVESMQFIIDHMPESARGKLINMICFNNNEAITRFIEHCVSLNLKTTTSQQLMLSGFKLFAKINADILYDAETAFEVDIKQKYAKSIILNIHERALEELKADAAAVTKAEGDSNPHIEKFKNPIKEPSISETPKGGQISKILPTLGVQYDSQFTFVILKSMLQAYNLKGIEVIQPSTLIIRENSHIFVEEGSHCTDAIRLPISFNAHTVIIPIVISKSPGQSHWIFLVAKDFEVTLVDTEVDDATFNLIKEMLPPSIEVKRSTHKQSFSDSCGVEGIDEVMRKIFPNEADIHKDPASAALVQNIITLHHLLDYLGSAHSSNEASTFESVKTFAFNLIKKAYFELILPYAEFAKGLVPTIVYKAINGEASISDLIEGLEAIKAQVSAAGIYVELARSINDAAFIPMKGKHKPDHDDDGEGGWGGTGDYHDMGNGDPLALLSPGGAKKEHGAKLLGNVTYEESGFSS